MNIPTTSLLASIILCVIKGMQHSRNPDIADLGDKLFTILIGGALIFLIVFYIF